MNRHQRRHPAEPTVVIAYLHELDAPHSFHASLAALKLYDLTHRNLIAGRVLQMRCGTGGLVEARNDVAAAFLNSRCDWLFVIDDDMGFQPDTVDRLIDAADPIERPIVGGLCFAQRETEPDGYGGYRTEIRPTILDWRDGRFLHLRKYPKDTLVECKATGSACMVIHRSVFEKIAMFQATPDAQPVGPHWYDRIPGEMGGKALGEDVSFCIRAGVAGFPIFVHTGIKTTHMKTRWIGEEDYDAEQFLKELHDLDPVSVEGPTGSIEAVDREFARNG